MRLISLASIGVAKLVLKSHLRIRGFTLIEVLLVLSILAIVVGMAQLNGGSRLQQRAYDQDVFNIQQWVVEAQQEARNNQQFRLLVGHKSGLQVFVVAADEARADTLELSLIKDRFLSSEARLDWYALGEQPMHPDLPQAEFISLIKPDGTLEPTWRVELVQTGLAVVGLLSDGLNPPYVERGQTHE